MAKVKNKIVIFDLDGVIFDTVDFLHERNQVDFPTITHEQSKHLFTGNIMEMIEKSELARRVWEPGEKESYEQDYTQRKRSAPLYHGLSELIQRLSQTCELVVNTSAWERNARPLLEREGLDGCFSLYATREFDPSKVEKFKHIAEKFEIEPEKMIFITDTIGDLMEAEKAHVPTIAVTWGIHSREDFGQVSHPNLMGIVDNVKELGELILKA